MVTEPTNLSGSKIRGVASGMKCLVFAFEFEGSSRLRIQKLNVPFAGSQVIPRSFTIHSCRATVSLLSSLCSRGIKRLTWTESAEHVLSVINTTLVRVGS